MIAFTARFIIKSTLIVNILYFTIRQRLYWSLFLGQGSTHSVTHVVPMWSIGDTIDFSIGVVEDFERLNMLSLFNLYSFSVPVKYMCPGCSISLAFV
jgi:hypothetical protein